MYKVGDFSKISRVSAKALRYYDERGLLKPRYVDAATGYRYYSIDQLPRLNRILVLKDLGLSLEQIGVLLDEQVSPSEIRGMLRLKQAELRQEVHEAQTRLSQIERRLQQIEQEDTVFDYDVVMKDVASQVIVSAREVVPSHDALAQRCTLLAHAVWSTISQAAIKATGPWGAIYHDAPHALDVQRPIDVEMAVVVDPCLLRRQSPWPHEQVQIRELPGSPSMACLVHTGDYQGLWDAYAAMLLWIATNGYQIVGACRIFYLRMQKHPVSEIQIPVKKIPMDIDFSDG